MLDEFEMSNKKYPLAIVAQETAVIAPVPTAIYTTVVLAPVPTALNPSTQ